MLKVHEKAKRDRSPADGTLLCDDELECAVDELIDLIRHNPFKREHETVVRIVALVGGVLMDAEGAVIL